MKRMCSVSSSHLASLLLLGAIQCWACSTNLTTTIRPLPTLGGSGLQVNALNEAGQITGYADLPGDVAFHACLVGGDAITDLGTLGGMYSIGSALNSSGQVAGESTLSGEAETHAVLFSGGSLIDLGTLGGSFSTAVAINDAGEVAGNSYTANDLTSEAFRYSGGLLLSLGTLGGRSSIALAINNAGSVTGRSSTQSDLETHAFLHTGGTMIDLGTLGGAYSTPTALNDSNMVVGESTLPNGETHAFVFSAGTLRDVGTLGGTFSSASAVNNTGQIVGASSTTDDAETHAFLYSGGTLTDLGTLGGYYSYATDLNHRGQVVGGSLLADNSVHAFLWQDGAMVDLNTLLPADSGWVLVFAQFINDAGRVVGLGTYNDVLQWFVLDPGAGASNNPPVAAAGPDQNVGCQTEVTLDASGSRDADGDTLTYQWSCAGSVFSTNSTVVVSFDVGTHLVTLTVTDPCGAVSKDEVIVQVTDTVAPTVSAPATVELSADSNCQAAVPDLLARIVAQDNCTPLAALVIAQDPAAGTLVNAGRHTITVGARDASGNIATTHVNLTVADTTAPVISSITADPKEICPSNHKLVPVKLTVAAKDGCDPMPGSKIVAITANPPVPPGDIQITGDLTAKLAATRGPKGSERIYTLTVRCTDASGNSSTGIVTVTVAKNHSRSLRELLQQWLNWLWEQYGSDATRRGRR